MNRVNVYDAVFESNASDFDLRGLYRTGHNHLWYEGDLFGLYPEANYCLNLDTYGCERLGAEMDGKGILEGAELSLGPQLWWGSNPTSLFKYSRDVNGYTLTGIFNRDLQTETVLGYDGRRELDANQLRSVIIPPFPRDRAALFMEKSTGKFGFTLGGIWGGSPLNGTSFQDVTGEPSNYAVVEDKVQSTDNWGGKAKITYEGGKINWYAQGGVIGLVASGGADQTQTFTGWRLKDLGSVNMSNFLTGFTYTAGNYQIAPYFPYQKPLVIAMPSEAGAPGRLRNVIDDPFAVRGNRETTAGELLITFDLSPATWMYDWDNVRSEDAKFAMSAGFVYRYLPTQQDAHIRFSANRTFLIFPDVALVEDLYEADVRIVSKTSRELAIIEGSFVGSPNQNTVFPQTLLVDYVRIYE